MTSNRHRSQRASNAWLEIAESRIPGATSTLAKSPGRLVHGISPLFTERARGANFWDIDGNRWLDCEMAMGAVPWGHARSEVVEAVQRAAGGGFSFSTPPRSEAELAGLLLERFPTFGATRFLKSGADTVAAAIRVSRVVTGRDVVIVTEYHGWAEDSAAGIYGGSPALGLRPDATRFSRFAPAPDLQRLVDAMSRGDVAAVVICPNNWTRAQVAEIRTACDAVGSLLVFDEVTSGQRIGRQATAGRYEIWPDFLCLSKGLANGLPLGALLGSSSLVEHSIAARITTAHATESIAIVAAIACEQLLAKVPAWPSWEDPARQMIDDLRGRLNGTGVGLTGDYASFAIRSLGTTDFWKDPVRELLVRELAKYGIFTKGYIVLSDAHSHEQLTTVHEALMRVADRLVHENLPKLDEAR